MSDAQHTPGPWSQEKQGVESKNFVIAMVCRNRVYGMTKNECYANARLIAAAPDLLEVLLFWKNESSRAEPSISVFNQMVDAAIAKVTGSEA